MAMLIKLLSVPIVVVGTQYTLMSPSNRCRSWLLRIDFGTDKLDNRVLDATRHTGTNPDDIDID